jgi:hypothetical protein
MATRRSAPLAMTGARRRADLALVITSATSLRHHRRLRRHEPRMSHLDPTTTLRPARSVVSQQLDGEAVLLDLERETYFSLNRVGARIWALIGEGLTFSAIVDRLADEFDASRTVIAADAMALAEELLAAGLVEPLPPSVASEP